MTTMILLYVCTSLLLVLIAIPLYLKKIPPNNLYGFRVKATLEDPELWYEVNRYSAGWLMFSGIVICLSALVFAAIPGLSIDAYSLLCLAVFTLTFIMSMGFSVQKMNSLRKK